MQGDTKRCEEIQGNKLIMPRDTWRYKKIQGDTRRYKEIQRDIRRYKEI